MKNNKNLINLWLCLGGLLLIFFNGKWIISSVAWICWVFIVRYYRKEKGYKGVLLPLLFIIFSLFISHRGFVPIAGILKYIVLVGLGVSIYIPFLIDRYLYHRVHGFKATFILPLSGVSFKFLLLFFNPFGTWDYFAYTQINNQPLMQLVSVTGIWGISFLLYWFYSFVNWIWENEFNIKRVKNEVIIFISIFTIIILSGEMRISLFPPESKTVKVASISVSTEELINDNNIRNFFLGRKINLKNKKLIKEKFNDINNKLVRLTEREANTGAKIIFWHEGNGVIFKEDEERFIKKIGKIAQSNNSYIMASLLVFTPDKIKFENKVVLLDDDGNKAFTYLKSKPVPGEASQKGKGELKAVDTPYGKIGSTICFDMDFPSLIRQAGKKDIDIMLIPASDWKEIDPIHTQMSVFRAVENGFNLVRQTNRGLSLATDYQGNVISAMSFYSTEDKVLISHVPVKGVRTIYSKIGNLFPWICVIMFILLTILALKSNKEGIK
ncbi:nitrilase-related carbon-nitrogen hydrolase [Thermohalobacter berrensis]|uniref:CN hydrolase domain-containing protein n=1 Tax=Thermohalobacter berrensis TaxID=99594 RepID=A0A419T4T8_9FIRM|nr:nitrilase-related carbon-nitrogen hydrolase [Thermohalobacter berrensis]RKD32456.1 hypothetical protein BET03_11120 [Thermohalobacter berrensis]